MFVSNHDRAQIKYLEEEVKSLRSQLETVVAHSVCAGWEIKSLQERLNSKNTQAKKRKVQVKAQYISSAEATQMLEEQERADAEKKRKEEETQAAKKAKDDQRKQKRKAGGVLFFGSLNNKTKDDLLDITFVLQLTGSDSNVPETKAALITMINTHLDNNAHLASDPTFAGLFLSRTRGRKRNANDESAPPLALYQPEPSPRPLSTSSTDDTSMLAEPDLPMVLFDETPGAGQFFQPINFTPPNFRSPGPSFPPQYPYLPPPIPDRTTDPHHPPSFYYPPPHG